MLQEQFGNAAPITATDMIPSEYRGLLRSAVMIACPPEIKFRIIWDIPERAINIPSYHDMHDDHQDRVVAVIEAMARDGAH